MIVTSRHAFTRFPVSTPAISDLEAALAAPLDRQADHELHLGRHTQAERLAWQAAAMREVGR